MDWTNIVIAIIGAGGFTTIFLIVEKKSAAVLENAQKLIDMYKSLAEEYKAREAKTQQISEAKEEALMLQVKMNSSLRHALDDAHTETAVARLMYCKKAKCVDRDPPFGSNADNVVESIKQTTRNEYQTNTRKRNGKGSDDPSSDSD